LSRSVAEFGDLRIAWQSGHDGNAPIAADQRAEVREQQALIVQWEREFEIPDEQFPLGVRQIADVPQRGTNANPFEEGSDLGGKALVSNTAVEVADNLAPLCEDRVILFGSGRGLQVEPEAAEVRPVADRGVGNVEIALSEL